MESLIKYLIIDKSCDRHGSGCGYGSGSGEGGAFGDGYCPLGHDGNFLKIPGSGDGPGDEYGNGETD